MWGAGARVLMTDTVGFIRKLPHHLVASFRATLEEVTEADLLLHVIDASHPAWEDQRAVVEDVLADLGASRTPIRHVFNKMDHLAGTQRLGTQGSREQPDAGFGIRVGRDGRRARPAAPGSWRPRCVHASLVGGSASGGFGRMLADLYRDAEVLNVGSEGSAVVVRARMDDAMAGRLRRAGASVSAGIEHD